MNSEKLMSDITKLNVKILGGCEGNGLYFNDYRVAGPKPWGGAPVILEKFVEIKDLVIALGISRLNVLIKEYAKIYPQGLKEIGITLNSDNSNNEP